jgi:hypothetical protein
MPILIGFTPYFQQRPDPLIPCEAKVESDNRGRDKHLGTACRCKAKITINGTPMCIRHAQQEALRLLIKDELAKVLP